MKRISVPFALLALALAAPAFAGDMHHVGAGGAFAPPALEPMKKLEGTWTGTAGTGDQTMDATVTYKVTANGSGVMETLFPGTSHEMVTMYTVDRGALVLTHYCAAGNQPRMRARAGGARELVFDFAGGAGIDPHRDQFMHDARIVFVDDDHLRTEWTDWNGGRPGPTRVFTLARRK